MSTNQTRFLRGLIVTLLVLLFLQFELGMTVNMSDPAHIPPFAVAAPAIWAAIQAVGIVAEMHAVLGGILALLAVVNLALALGSGIRRVQVFGVLSFLTVIIAAGGGLYFVASGFQDDHMGHAMATNFMLSFVFYFMEAYYLKSDNPAAQAAPRPGD